MPREDEREKILRLILDKHCRESLQSGQAVDAELLEACPRCAPAPHWPDAGCGVSGCAAPCAAPSLSGRAALCIGARMCERVQGRVCALPRGAAAPLRAGRRVAVRRHPVLRIRLQAAGSSLRPSLRALSFYPAPGLVSGVGSWARGC